MHLWLRLQSKRLLINQEIVGSSHTGVDTAKLMLYSWTIRSANAFCLLSSDLFIHNALA